MSAQSVVHAEVVAELAAAGGSRGGLLRACAQFAFPDRAPEPLPAVGAPAAADADVILEKDGVPYISGLVLGGSGAPAVPDDDFARLVASVLGNR